MLLIVVLLASVILTTESSVNGHTKYVDVAKFGARGDGRNDDSEAFQRAWDTVCHGERYQASVISIPKWGKFMLPTSTMFKGPCNSTRLKVQLDGHIIAPPFHQNELSDMESAGKQWITFLDIENLEVRGHGSIEGSGQRSLRNYGLNELGDEEEEEVSELDQEQYDETETEDAEEKLGEIYEKEEYNDEEKKLEDSVEGKSTSVAFFNCNHLKIWGITTKFSAKNHISISDCQDVSISNIHIHSPGNSKNTDGIDITRSSWIRITDSDIRTGDDCIEINSGTSNVNITGVFCGPGHGISIGSFKAVESDVENIHVKHCTFSGTQNGARIKNFPFGMAGFVRSITFEDITLKNVKRPIVINQFYHDKRELNQSVGVQISDVKFIGFEGTCSDKEAISLKCLDGPGCTNINLENVHIKGSRGQPVKAVCSNVHGSALSTSPQVNCLADGGDRKDY